METKHLEDSWQASMDVVSAMKRERIDTGEAVKKLRDAKVLINLCRFDEHAHVDELLEAEKAVEDAQGYLISLIKDLGLEEKFTFKTPEKKEPESQGVIKPPRTNKGETWVRIKVKEGTDIEELIKSEQVNVVDKSGATFTLVGEKASLRKILKKVSENYSNP